MNKYPKDEDFSFGNEKNIEYLIFYIDIFNFAKSYKVGGFSKHIHLVLGVPILLKKKGKLHTTK